MKSWLTFYVQQIKKHKKLLVIWGMLFTFGLGMILLSLSTHSAKIDSQLERMDSLLGKPKEEIKPTPVGKPEPEEKQEEVKTEPVNYNYQLEIPEINLNSKMIASRLENNQITVPDSEAGYYKIQNGYLLVGHTPGIFENLINMPREIYLTMDGKKEKYTLYSHEITRVDSVNMKSVMAWKGIVLLTCNGSKVGNTYSHRLILYYTQ